MTTAPRSLTLEFDQEPPSVNKLLRMHHRRRSELRNILIALVLSQKPRRWGRLQRARIDADIRLWALRDPLELPGCLKVHLDAIHRAGVIVDDGPRHIEVGEIRQQVSRGNRGVTIRVTEVAA